ncbi:hypothetical protein [Streptomyces sp. NPDC058045]|uniref:hypothetical protein n=1 Tax=Streptomyces sp. NPDC058045 TaxID=3346311 RepID=UPI0036E6EBEF
MGEAHGGAVRMVRVLVGLALGALWWWAVLRLAFSPRAGVVEGAVAAGGWGLSLLPVHCVPKSQAAGAVGSDQWRPRIQAWLRTQRARRRPRPPAPDPHRPI